MAEEPVYQWLAEVKALYATGGRAAILLTDDNGITTGYALDPGRLAALVVPLLGLMSEWADDPNQQSPTQSGAHLAEISRRAIPGQSIELSEGRHDKETAVHVFVGKVELTFYVPLATAMSAATKLMLETTSADESDSKPN